MKFYGPICIQIYSFMDQSRTYQLEIRIQSALKSDIKLTVTNVEDGDIGDDDIYSTFDIIHLYKNYA